MTADVWGIIKCPLCDHEGLTVRETRKGTGKGYCPSCRGTVFYNGGRGEFCKRHGLELPEGAEAAPVKPPRKKATKKATTTPKKRSATDGKSKGGSGEGHEGAERDGSSIAGVFGL